MNKEVMLQELQAKFSYIEDLENVFATERYSIAKALHETCGKELFTLIDITGGSELILKDAKHRQVCQIEVFMYDVNDLLDEALDAIEKYITCKDLILKIQGTGVNVELRDFNAIKNNSLYISTKYTHRVLLDILEKYYVSALTKHNLLNYNIKDYRTKNVTEDIANPNSYIKHNTLEDRLCKIPSCKSVVLDNNIYGACTTCVNRMKTEFGTRSKINDNCYWQFNLINDKINLNLIVASVAISIGIFETMEYTLNTINILNKFIVNDYIVDTGIVKSFLASIESVQQKPAINISNVKNFVWDYYNFKQGK